MTYNDIWRRIAAATGDGGESRAVARMLLEEKFGMTMADIICGAVERLSDADAAWLADAVDRLCKAEPVQYVLGGAWFCGMRFGVRPGALIPRPETEWLVTEAVRWAASAVVGGARPLRLLDIGTGSGCIAISIKKRVPDAYVEAWDVSDEALSIAADNARTLGADVHFVHRDALCAMPGGQEWDCIVSNPPYICQHERKDMHRNVLDYEPATALFVPDDDPLLFYRAITRHAVRTLRPGGRLMFECNTRHADDTARMMGDEGMVRVAVCDDCFGMKRFAMGVASPLRHPQ